MKSRGILRAVPAIMAVRAVVGAALVGTTWWNAHWSVALSLTLLLVRAEINDYLKDRDSHNV